MQQWWTAGKGNIAGFFSAAGVLAHYVGDACQPLHISYMFNGKPGNDGKTGDGVHEAFETKMINRYNKEIMPLVGELIKKPAYKNLLQLASGKEAAAATVDLMKETFATISPGDIVDAFVKLGSDFPDKFWSQKGKKAVPGLFANGAYTLASLWNSAWELGTGGRKPKSKPVVDSDEIVALYEDESFLPSVNIKGISEYLK